MGSITDLSSSVPRIKRPPTACAVCHLIKQLPDDEVKALNALLADPEVRYSDIAEGLAAKDVANLDRSQYARHARGGCGARANLRPKLAQR